MKSAIAKKSFWALCAFLFLGATRPDVANSVLTVMVNGIDTHSGSIRVAVFNDPNKFLDRHGYAYSQSTPVGANNSVRINFNIPYGTYAITCYHDINDNHVLDQNYMGIPQEPYAMSNNVNIKWRRPSFDETKFVVSKPSQAISFEVKRWKDR